MCAERLSRAGKAPVSRRIFALRVLSAAAAPGLRVSGPVEITGGPLNHFVANHGPSSWDGRGRFLLVHQVDFCNREPKPGDSVTVGVIDRAAGGSFLPVGRSTAWSWQWGTKAQWLPLAPDRWLLFNVRLKDGWGCRFYDVRSRTWRQIPFALFSVSPRKTLGVSLNFSRIAWTAPGYGYVGVEDPYRYAPAPDKDGLLLVDLVEGRETLAVTLDTLVRFEPKPVFGEAYHWVHDASFSPDGRLVAFLHRWRSPGGSEGARVFTLSERGGKLRLLREMKLSCPLRWFGPNELLIVDSVNEGGRGFFLMDVRSGASRPVAPEAFTTPGHAAFSPARRFLVTDCEPDRQGNQRLAVVSLGDQTVRELGRYPCPPPQEEGCRCYLRPHWDPTGREVFFDGASGKGRQVYRCRAAGAGLW